MDKKVIILRINENMILKTFAPEDAPTIFALIDSCRDHLNRNNENTAKKYPDIESVLESIVHPQEPKRLRFGIWDNNVFVGSVNIEGKGNGTAELGYWIGERFLGNSYAGKASYKLIRNAFKGGKIKLIIAEIAETNLPSMAIVEKLGFILHEKKAGRLIYHLERWIPFYINACIFFGDISSRADWEKARDSYEDPDYLLNMKLSDLTPWDGPMPDFGEGARYNGITLKNWFNMKNFNPND